MRMYEVIMMTLAGVILATGFMFGVDREMARRDYEKAVRDGDFEKPIVGCMWNYNCEYYTQMLYDSID